RRWRRARSDSRCNGRVTNETRLASAACNCHLWRIFAIFMLAFATHRILPLRGIAVLLAIALALRVVGAVARKNVSATSAS
ncbi:MAG: hypothetical protein ACXVZV_12545, partial [Terriglobales bacterium]